MGVTQLLDWHWTRYAQAACVVVLATGCGGGGTGNPRDSGPQQTTLTVAASDADGDTLNYQWRATAGTIDNRNAPTTVWKLPPGPGIHFAYVTVSDGKGGYVQQQYAVSSDALEIAAQVPAQARHKPPAIADFNGSALRLRFDASNDMKLTSPDGNSGLRQIYLPDVPVQVVHINSGAVVFTGNSDANGEVSLPKLVAGDTYQVLCGNAPGSVLQNCDSFSGSATARAIQVSRAPTEALNLRLYGHVGLADGGVCGTQSEYFQRFSSATVQLLQTDGAMVTAPRRVNRFGDYMIEAAVAVRASLRLRISCEGYSTTLDVPASSNPAGYVVGTPIELSHQISNSRPKITRMVANGPDGNVRGRMITFNQGSGSNILPGEDQFLSYKGLDTRLSACRYYRAFGMAKDCDAQGNMVEPVTMEEWKREQELPPYKSAGRQASATYINKMDLNLVRRMTATEKAPDNIAFLVCNAPGPDGQSQKEVDDVLAHALDGERLVACVGMEWSVTPGANNNEPFTKFATFGPDGSLLTSINLDGRGEKYLPGACVACHGGSAYNGRFPETGNPSPYLGSRFLPFDTANFLFGSAGALGEPIQSADLRRLNQFVSATEGKGDTPTRRLVKGWYEAGTDTPDHGYVPEAWLKDGRPGAQRFYREVVATSCRTCHTALGTKFDWDSGLAAGPVTQIHACGGSPSLAQNATMPNALITRDRLAEKARGDPTLAALMRAFLGCDGPLPDPAYPVR
ncbi:hypothetical protein QTI66_01460 [Variovorax sp. J22R133]|uniref:hypothetical protein n=1 Tax=Variovorax brevis TaxID=3053503 RepID=UPI0025758C03|nr:hypothetical protein [Variovorax sp. J22R133]MDM0110793.1 hypothetical protein [Variovorax sp. J22R133]